MIAFIVLGCQAIAMENACMQQQNSVRNKNPFAFSKFAAFFLDSTVYIVYNEDTAKSADIDF